DGKGSVQEDFVLSDGSDLHLTVERWYLPNGVTIDKKGLTPDVTVQLAGAADAYDVTQPSLGYAKDTQLNTALTLLHGQSTGLRATARRGRLAQLARAP